ncbi:MAG: TRAP transporter TatT component family protein [Deltaproteobacteria bacterium]|nr:TRAP transporter TatT component family protein [Deltaproteobacteria bacterium]
MRNVLSCSMLLMMFLLATVMPTISWGTELSTKAEMLWNEREDPGKAAEAIAAYEDLLKERPADYEVLMRLSRLHYWVGQILESTNEKEALEQYARGREYGKKASEAAPEEPGGYFFEAANLARKNNLKGTFSNLFGISTVRKLNEKAASLDPEYFYRGTDRFFCAFYTKLPGLLGGSTTKAIEFGKRAVEAFPNYAGNRYFLAEAYVKDGNNDLARKELEAAVVLPDDELSDFVPEQRMEKKRADALLKRIGK